VIIGSDCGTVVCRVPSGPKKYGAGGDLERGAEKWDNDTGNLPF